MLFIFRLSNIYIVYIIYMLNNNKNLLFTIKHLLDEALNINTKHCSVNRHMLCSCCLNNVIISHVPFHLPLVFYSRSAGRADEFAHLVVKRKCSSFFWVVFHWFHWIQTVRMFVTVHKFNVELHNIFTGKLHSTRFTFTLHLYVFDVNIEQMRVSLVIFNLMSPLCPFRIDPDVTELAGFNLLVVFWNVMQPQVTLCEKDLGT